MRRLMMFIAAVSVTLGCRSQPGWSPFCGPGSRVPPPATGSYGSPNSYYQPGVQTVPATVPPTGARSLTTPSNQWSTVRDDDARVASLSSGVKSSLSSRQAQPSPALTAASTQPRLNGMRVNELRGTSEPAAFTPPESMSELRPTIAPVNRTSGGAVQPASAGQRDGGSESSVSSAVWQSRNVSSSRSVNR